MKKNFAYVVAICFPTAALLVLLGIFVQLLPLYASAVGSAAALERFVDPVRTTESVTLYLIGNGELPGALTDREQLHLADIRQIVWWLQCTAVITIALLVVAIMVLDWQTVKVMARKGFGVGGALILLGAVIGTIFFEPLFYLFHTVSFKNNFWQLDPRTDLLIVLFPPNFFMTIMVVVAGVYVAVCLGVITLVRDKTK